MKESLNFKKMLRYFIFFQQRKIIWRKFFLTLSLALFLFFLIYYSSSFFLISQEEICLENLKQSFMQESLCHEDCAAQRVKDKKCLSLNLKRKPKIEKKMQSYIYNENMQLDFRIFLIGVFRNVYGADNPPESLFHYLSLQSGNKSLQAAIIRFFNFSNLSANKDNPLDYYFAILENENSANEIRLEAAVKIATYKDGEKYFSIHQLTLIESIIFNRTSDKYLRQSLVLLLADYLSVIPEETKILLEKIYQSNFSGDNISRAFAADLLGVPLPEISQAEWDAYYQR